MAILTNDMVGSFEANIKGVKVGFIADEINIVRKVKGDIIVSHYVVMNRGATMWNKSWGANNGEVFYCEDNMKSYEYVQSLVKSAIQIKAYVDATVSFDMNVSDKDYLSELDV